MKDKRLLKAFGITAGVLALSVGAVLGLTLGLKNPGDTITNTDTTSYVKVDEIWDSENKTFNADNAKLLMSYLNNADINSSNILNLSQVTKKSSDICKNTYNSKTTSQDIIVRMGGLDWQVVYLTTYDNGDAVVTLWLSNNQQEAWADSTVYTQNMGDYYGFYEGGLYSSISAGWYKTTTTSSSGVYDTSYIRAVTLNNGGQYSIDEDNLSEEVAKDPNNPFALFTMEEYGLTDYIVKPREISYQASQNIWTNDYIWLPCNSEVTNSNNMTNTWKTSQYQRRNYDGATTSLTGSVGSLNEESILYTGTALRWLGSSVYAYLVPYTPVSGVSNSYLSYYTNRPFAVRPALHLNLFDIARELDLLDFEYRGYGDYFTDYGIPTSMDSIASTTITGSGVEDDPYTINSTNDFIFLSNQSIENAYVKLNCDIYLNEETFDENAYPTGGDHIVYQWQPIAGWDGVTFDGQGCTCYGLYLYKRADQDNVWGVFINLKAILNLNIDNAFVHGGKGASGLCYSAETINNCTTRNGKVSGVAEVSGLANIVNEIEDSNNYFDIVRLGASAGEFYFAGLACHVRDTIINCNNFAEVIAKSGGAGYTINSITIYGGAIAGGICATTVQGCDLLIENSNNYGSVQAAIPVGGILGFSLHSELVNFKNCVNYGNVEGYHGSIVGGFMGIGRNVILNNCTNYGKTIYNKQSAGGQLIGSVTCGGTNSLSIPVNVSILNCSAVHYSAQPLINNIGNVVSLELLVDGLLVDNNDNTYKEISPIIAQSAPDKSKIILKNIKANIFVHGVAKLCLFTNANSAQVYVNSVYIESNKNNLYISYNNSEEIQCFVGGMLLITKSSNAIRYKRYYGSDFSGFYISDRTGEIGIKALSGAGQFQTTLTEEELTKREYVK